MSDTLQPMRPERDLSLIAPYIVGHVSPDLDCIGALWLLQGFGPFSTHTLAFVNTGNPDPVLLSGAAAVVDTGRVYYVPYHRYDHHQFTGPTASNTCAMSLVYDHLLNTQDIAFLLPLVDLITKGDNGNAPESHRTGLHALLSAFKAHISRPSDHDVVAYGYTLLDAIASTLKAQQDAATSLHKHKVYVSNDGLFVALKNAPNSSTQAAFNAGFKLVLFYSEYGHPRPTVAVGIQRGGEGNPTHCGDLVHEMTLNVDMPPETRSELVSWFRHESGFFAGRGTGKSPDPRPLNGDFLTLAETIDKTWAR